MISYKQSFIRPFVWARDRAKRTTTGALRRLDFRPNNSDDTLENIAAFIQEWTPFLLVASYFVFSTAIYTLCTRTLIAMFWFVYLITNFYIAGSTCLEAFLSLVPTRNSKLAVKKLEENNWVFPTPDKELLVVDLIIVAYLPNEQDLIVDRLHYALEQIVYPRTKYRVNLVYNTPTPIEPLESELRLMTTKYPHLRIVKVPGSNSKADNLNYFFTLNTGADIITIFDADHYTHPHGPRWAVERFMLDKKIDVVQGRCVIFNSKVSLLASMIAVEFDKIYAVSHPGRAALYGFALFTGSNGYWRAPLIRDLKMDGTILTEDIDSSLRALSRGAKIFHDNNVVSYELAPTQYSAMWKQRLRWAQGWTQVSMRHIKLVFFKAPEDKRDMTTRFGLLSLLFIREASYYLVTQYCCLVLSFVITDFPKSPGLVAKFIFFQYKPSEWFFIISVLTLIGTLLITARIRSEFVSWRMMILFSIIYTPYLVFTATQGLYGHARQVCNYTKWNTTKRT